MSLFREIAAEGIILGGGGRAILLQIANPAVGEGVARHSGFTDRPVSRLNNTVSYAYATVFASPEELAQVVAWVNRAHGPVHDVAQDGHPAYDAFDPRDQLWVAATLYQTAVDVYERVFGRLDAANAEGVYQQYRVLGTALQVPADFWPADLGAFREYWSRSVDQLHVTAAARRVAHDLLTLRSGPIWLRAVMPLVALLTAGLLPANVRREFGFRWTPRHQRRFDRVFTVVSVVYPRLPRPLRTLPKTLSMRNLRRTLAGVHP